MTVFCQILVIIVQTLICLTRICELSMRCNHPSSGMTWTKMSDQWCRRGATFVKLALAQASCLKLGTSCHGVYDERCDERRFSLCDGIHFSVPQSTGCLYKPTTGLSTAFEPMTGTELKSAVHEYLSDYPTGNCAEKKHHAGESTTTSVYESYDKTSQKQIAVGIHPCTRAQPALKLAHTRST